MTVVNENPLIRTLREIRESGRIALCGYFLAGYPTPDEFFRAVRAARDLDVIEFGIPSVNPTLDGPVIARAHEVVTQQCGIGAEAAMALIGGLRHIPQPRFVMTYTEVGRALPGFLRLCTENNIHGMIAPDIEPEEGHYVKSIAEALNLAVLTMIDARAANATLRQRIELGDIVYLKAGTGRTGQPADIEGDLGDVLAQAVSRIRALASNTPIAVGIGLQKPEQVAALARLGIDMVIVGTRIIESLQTGERALVEYIQSLRDATHLSSV
jgi:tryptophan synthase alpha chain